MRNSYFLLLQILQAFHNETSSENRVKDTVNMIIKSITLQRHVDTIIFFGTQKNLNAFLTFTEGKPKVIISSPEHVVEFYTQAGFNNQMILIFVGNILSKLFRPVLKSAFQNVQGYTCVVFITPESFKISTALLTDHFKWCWNNGFSDALLLKPNISVPAALKAYSFLPFPNITVIEIPLNNDTIYFPTKLNNFHGLNIHTPMQFDPPRVFAVKSRQCGYAWKMFSEYFKARNGKLTPISSPRNVYNIDETLKKLRDGIIHFSVHPFYPLKGVHLSYPLRMTKWRLLVPSKGETGLFLYYIHPFKRDLWLMLILTLCMLSFVYFVWQLVPRHHATLYVKHVDFSAAFFFILRLLISQPTPMHNWSRVWLPYTLLLLLIIIFGFLLVNLYLANLTSFFTTTIWNQQLNTMQDLVRENLSVYVGSYEQKVIMKNYGLPKGFVDLLVPSNVTHMLLDVINLTAGRAYAAREDLLLFSLAQLSFSNNPRFRFAEEYITTLPVGYLLPSHSQFEMSLNIFIMQCDAAGLLKKWMTEATAEGFQTGILKLEASDDVLPAPLQAKRFSFAWMILACGWTVGAVVFLFEKLFIYLVKIRIQVHYY